MLTPDLVHHASTEDSLKSVLVEAPEAKLGTPNAVPSPDFTWNPPERASPGW